MVKVNGQPIYEALTPQERPEWELVGTKGQHGKWCIATYCLSVGDKIDFVATANGREDITKLFVVGEVDKVDFEGYQYGSDICGWIVSL